MGAEVLSLPKTQDTGVPTALDPPSWEWAAPREAVEQDRYICPVTGIRFYYIPALNGGRIAVPGVTSILGDDAPPEEKLRLENWRRKEEASGRDPDAGRKRGSATHAVLESVVRGDLKLEGEADEDTIRQSEVLSYASGMEVPLRRFDSFLWSEKPLISGWSHCWSAPRPGVKPLARVWSRTWGFAGTPDLIGRMKGLTVLSDFKTSARPYFRSPGRPVPQHQKISYLKYVKTVRQLCGYRLAIRETLDLEIDRLQIIVGLPKPGRHQVFWVPQVEMERETEAFKRACVRFWERQARRVT